MKQLHTIDLSFDKSSENRYLSNTLITKIWETLENWEKILLYLNKRGNFSSYICSDCSYIYSCPSCDLSLNIHANPERIMCHHCFYECSLASTCWHCGWIELKKVWVWTEQIEWSIGKLFPKASIYRFDTDNLKNVSSKKMALRRLESTDIIIGTKMITTGFNIKNIWLIWVILIEQELNIPKYNTEEQVYSNLRQLIGRWGRVWQKTEIVLQTFAINNPLIQHITQKNYRDFFMETLTERKLFLYPPFYELVYIVHKNIDREKSLKLSEKLYNQLLEKNSSQNNSITLVWKPIKRNNQYFSKIIIKWEDLRNFLEPFRKIILKDSNISIIFEV